MVNNSVKKVLIGQVVSKKMQKTIVVQIDRSYIDQMVHKTMRTSKTYKVHDEQEVANVGDTVEIYEGRPVSKTKYMYLNKVLHS